MFSFLVWIIWRTVKKSKRRAAGELPPPKRALSQRLANRIPFLRQRGWQNLADPSVANVMPPSYREKSSIAGASQLEGYYIQEKSGQLVAMGSQPPGNLRPVIALNTQFPGGNMNSGMHNMSPVAMQTPSPLSASQTMPPFMVGDVSPVGTIPSSDANGTFRSRMPDAFYNQSELARQPSDAYDPAKRIVNRASELSSLSSGFGDGDIIVAEPYLQPLKPASTNMRQTTNLVGRFSWMSGSRRDTVYTETSEDLPPRFRTVNSWVNQQTGRVKRAEEREPSWDAPPVPQLPGQGVPGFHNPPAEQTFGMMMEDGEVPRSVPESLVNRKPSPPS